MMFGWAFSITNASLPYFGISDYRKFAICLPFETSDRASLGNICYANNHRSLTERMEKFYRRMLAKKTQDN